MSDYSSGTNYLIKQGATPVTSSLDILHECEFSVDIEEVYEKGTTNKMQQVASSQKNLFSTANLNEQEKRLVAKLNEPKSMNQLARELEISMNELSVHIMSLELQGVVCEEFGVVRKTI
jgi:predicted Rossmann fold nucleotide-binding protein DprA/Smf involved in DNA uptake